MRNATPMLAELLRDAGWSTAAFTGGGYLSPDFGFVRGFDRYTVHDPLITSEGLPPLDEHIGAEARALSSVDWDNQLRLEAAYGLKLPAVQDWIERNRLAPEFLFLHTYAAHQYLPPQRIYDEELAGSTSKLTFGPALGELTNARFDREPPSDADIDHLRRLYGACVRSADEGFGAFLDFLETSGLADTSYVVVFSDHGEELFEHGDFGHSNDLRQSLLAVPLMIRGPGIEPTRIPEPISLLDLGPTLLALVGQAQPEGFIGHPLVTWREGRFDVASRVATSTAGAFSEVSHHSYFKDSLLLGSYKLVRDYGPRGRGETFTDRLYDLEADPGEFDDVGPAHPDTLEQLQKRLTAWRALADARAAGEASGGEVSEETKSQLEDLGYF
jgi:arylsulfatase A-like enzyme